MEVTSFSSSHCRASLLVLTLCLSIQASHAGSAMWELNPTSNDWDTATNWSPETVPSEGHDIAAFGISNVTTVNVPASHAIDRIVFKAGASAYTINLRLSFYGAGVVNNSGVTQNFDSSLAMAFDGRASAGAGVVYTNNGSSEVPFNAFFDHSNAGSATLIMNGPLPGEESDPLRFEHFSSAAHSTIINNGPRGGDKGGATYFYDHASAGSSTIIVNPGGYVFFTETATADKATLMIAGGEVEFGGKSVGGLAQLILSDGALVQVTDHFPEPLTLGSLAGTGVVGFGGHLGIGTNGLDTNFAGILYGDSVSKVGSGTLILSGENIYNGSITVEEGTLLLHNKRNPFTVTGPVQVNGGTFGGRSNSAAAVTIGSGNGPGAYLAPGFGGPGVLVIRNTLTFKADGAYDCDLSIDRSKADRVVCKVVTIESGAQFALKAKGNQSLAPGTVFTVIDNDSRDPIAGTFANLPDNSTLTANGNTLQVNYEGGNGNDLTLTVVP